MSKALIETFQPLIGTVLDVKPDGTSQLSSLNTGRFGFWCERQMGIYPNNYREPDFGSIEIKTVKLTDGKANKSTSLGNFTKSDLRIVNNGYHNTLNESKIFSKIKKTFFIFYEVCSYGKDKYGDCYDKYRIDHLGYLDLTADKNQRLYQTLNRDYEFCIEQIRKIPDYDHITYNGPKGQYIKMNYKGNSKGYYPNWTISGPGVRLMRDYMKVIR